MERLSARSSSHAPPGSRALANPRRTRLSPAPGPGAGATTDALPRGTR